MITNGLLLLCELLCHVSIDSGRCALQPLLVNLPQLDANAFADYDREQLQRLLEGIAAMLLNKEEEVPHPSYQVWLVLGRSQLPFTKEIGVTLVHFLSRLFPPFLLTNSRRGVMIRLDRW